MSDVFRFLSGPLLNTYQTNPGDRSDDPNEPGDPPEPSDPSEGSGADNDHGDGGFHDGPGARGGERLDSSSSGLSERAVGDFEESDLSERACVSPDNTDLARGISESRQSSIESLLKGLQGYDDIASSFDASDNVCRVEEKPSGERSSGWTSLDMLAEKISEKAKFAADFVGGVADFAKNYVEMRSVGGDKYYHCMANCESTQRGPGGELAADLISTTREGIDYYKNQLKGMTPAESTADCIADMRANLAGQEAGRGGIRCYDACRPMEPRWQQK